MDRRLFTWLMLTTAMFFLYLSMRQQVPPPNQLQGGAGVEQNAEAEVGELEVSDAQLLQNESKALTLGSMDPAKKYNLLVTLTTRGAGVERVELVGQKEPGSFKFRALEHESGYLGYLGLREGPSTSGEELIVPTALEVRVVPDGSAAQAAKGSDGSTGLQVGDLLKRLDGAELTSAAELERLLEETKVGQQVTLDVRRGDQDLKFTAILSQAPLDILRTQPFDSEKVGGNEPVPSLRTTLGSFGDARVAQGFDALKPLRRSLDYDWEVRELPVEGGEGVEFRLSLDSFMESEGKPLELDLVKRYRLLPSGGQNDGYLLDLETLIVNRGDREVRTSFRQEGLNGLTLEGWWYSVKISPHMFAGAGQRDVIYKCQAHDQEIATTRQIADRSSKGQDVILLSENEDKAIRTLSYIGVDAQYFNASILPHPESPNSLTNLRTAGAKAIAQVTDIQKAQLQATNTGFYFETEEQSVAAGSEISQRYQIFLGPKDTPVLASHGLESTIEYGWFPWIAKPLSAILHFFYSIVRNYGLAIVMLTVVVRGLMFPLGRKAAMNAQRMQELQPELQKITEKYKDNMEKRAKAMQELYAKHNFKPLAGCLPMFIQLPIFIGLYRCLSVDISLRQEPLLMEGGWCSNLAGPDQLLDWSSWMPEFFAGRGTGWLGPYFNILPMVTVALFLLQQKMLMPKATDEQTRMTQNMMQFMTIFMGVLFFKVPSGLCIYFITSSIWSLVERKLVKRMVKPPVVTPETPSPEPRRSATKKNREPLPEKPKGRLQELKEMLEKPAVKSATQRGTNKDRKRKR